ncbi:hypothetical protein [Halomarina oriensis]|uniref:Uncharacterized protein n=1 Tax=Halomarina oriensis TaxID=671145 RepID=A0A6B0GJZ3_9EURY|nr:hypothetical protein [Halomarina oriensis]MWG33123.1 hypothetical protein [Halomarina oriensis]
MGDAPEELVEDVVRIVDAQTSPKQPNDVADHTIVRALVRRYTRREGGGEYDAGTVKRHLSPSEAREAIEAAVAAGRLVEQDGRYAISS